MEISSYQADSLLGPRDKSRIVERAPITPLSPISGGNGGTDQQTAEDEISFFDTLIDTVNPLQHIPGVSTAYQAATGDEANPIASMAGGFLFGGPVGLAAGAASSFFEMITGKSLMGHAMAFLDGEDLPDQGTDGLTDLGTSTAAAHEPLIRPMGTSLNVENYQAFAQAQAQQNIGFGALDQQVSWSSNIWTANALKDATGLYETNQNLADKAKINANSTA
ncbi:MAG: hypothetical protein OQK24_11355 [Magnetovibrio sp.]|nr:hypothetical protein [Magnetovibrio sp.]